MPDTSKIIAALKKLYPDAACSLEYDGDPWKLLIAARLSAQCTDARVNIVCVPLFERYQDVQSMAAAELTDVEEIIKPCGLYHSKATSIIAMSRQIVENHNGEVPNSMNDLLKLPGVGRKIANLILGDVFGIPGIVADTHCIRINGRLGFYSEDIKDAVKAETILTPIIPAEEQSSYCHRMVMFGREYCAARNPVCEGKNGVECPLKDLCNHYKIFVK